jgi:hypothetical protein
MTASFVHREHPIDDHAVRSAYRPHRRPCRLKARPTTRLARPKTRLMRCSSTDTIIMLSSSCDLDWVGLTHRHVIIILRFLHTHHHRWFVTLSSLRCRLTHAPLHLTRMMRCSSTDTIIMLSSSCVLTSSCYQLIIILRFLQTLRHIIVIDSSMMRHAITMRCPLTLLVTHAL